MAKRYLMWVLGTFFIVLFLCSFAPASACLSITIAIFLMFIPAIVIKYSLKKTVIGCLISALTAVLLFFGTQTLAHQTEEQLIDHSAFISGEITDVGSNAAGDLSRYKVRLKSIEGEKLKFYQQFFVYVYTDHEGHIPGEKIEGTLKFYETPLEFGMGKEDRILLSSYLEGDELNFLPCDGRNLYRILYKLRCAVQNRIRYGSIDSQNLIRAVCFGDTDRLDPDLYVSLRRIGLSHVMAVSGLHLSFAVLLFNFLFILLGIHYRPRYLIGIFISLLFTAAVGFPLSCVRACVMLAIFSLGMALDLFPDGMTSLSVAAFLILLLNPFAVRDIGFLLSVSATAGIITMRSPIESFLFPKKISKNHRINKVYRDFTGVFSFSVAASVATFPITIVVFGSVSLLAPFANILLIYPIQGVFMLGILTVLLNWIPGIGALSGFLCDLLYKLIYAMAIVLGKLSFANIAKLDWVGIVLSALFILVIAVSVFLYLRHKFRVFIPLFTLFLCFAITFGNLNIFLHPDDTLEIAFIDVGQGDCTVVSKDHSAVIIDYGGSSKKRYNLIDYLQRKEIYQIELLAFTHLHSDHTNGLNTLKRNVYIDSVWYPDLIADSPETLNLIHNLNGKAIEKNGKYNILGDVQIEVLTDAVFENKDAKENEKCVCYRITYGSFSLLITGDLEGEGEMNLLQNDLTSSVLKAGHHGSDTSSLYPFLKAVSPEITIISVGENTYGLPDQTAIDRISTLCGNIYSTAKEGTIRFKTDGKILERIYE